MAVLDSVCPLDCPDTCSLSVTVEDGRLTRIDGSHRNPLTDGYICAKVRRYDERVYSPLRVLHPQRRVGAKGEGRFERISWDEAIALIATAFAPSSPSTVPRRSYLPLRRLERPARRQCRRRALLRAPRCVAVAHQPVRDADRRGLPRHVRRDARRAAARLRAGALHHSVGREPVGDLDPPRPACARGAGRRRVRGGDRSAPHAARAHRRSPSRRRAPAPTSCWRWR
jgi:hypothetical protein